MGARQAPSSKFFLKGALFLLIVCAALFLARPLWLPALGAVLVHDDGAGKAEIAVVLAGDSWGYRLSKGADLVKQGYAPHVLVSGPPGIYGINEADAAIQFAVRKGYPAEWFVPLYHTALSTREEAAAVLDWMNAHQVHSFLLVTSNYHTARARRIFRSAERERGGGPDIRVVASDDRFYRAADWWCNREGRKTAFMEWSKTISSLFGI